MRPDGRFKNRQLFNLVGDARYWGRAQGALLAVAFTVPPDRDERSGLVVKDEAIRITVCACGPGSEEINGVQVLRNTGLRAGADT